MMLTAPLIPHVYLVYKPIAQDDHTLQAIALGPIAILAGCMICTAKGHADSIHMLTMPACSLGRLMGMMISSSSELSACSLSNIRSMSPSPSIGRILDDADPPSPEGSVRGVRKPLRRLRGVPRWDPCGESMRGESMSISLKPPGDRWKPTRLAGCCCGL